MNKRRTIYRGFNKRRKNKMIKVYIIGLSVCIVSAYGYIQFKNSDIFKNLKTKVASIEFKIPFLNSDKKEDGVESFDYDDVSKELDKSNVESNNDKNSESKEDVKVAQVKDWNVYTIQVASVEDKNEIKKVEEELSKEKIPFSTVEIDGLSKVQTYVSFDKESTRTYLESVRTLYPDAFLAEVKEKIPFSTVEIDGLSKVQTYVSFDKESTRTYLESVRTLYPDAFLAEVKMPMLSLEYTSKYSYLESISEQLTNLIENFKLESNLWSSNNNELNMEEYNKILTNRKSIVENIENEANKIDYKGAEIFKENLITYANNIDKNIETASKSANEQNYNISEGIYLSSLQGYLNFINSIQ